MPAFLQAASVESFETRRATAHLQQVVWLSVNCVAHKTSFAWRAQRTVAIVVGSHEELLKLLLCLRVRTGPRRYQLVKNLSAPLYEEKSSVHTGRGDLAELGLSAQESAHLLENAQALRPRSSVDAS